ncbi:major facilitator superfamily domain-containing protein [Lipomyces tetrasporus]|uniref:Major facilitator superfamily domain-containing protein n=1 Tax=Lipomyces tetrasporus TaxID=54092 RepID=A0AAD7QPJ8_9ASCO|nr:major facilitator superfamily domain-containing protein [Lipomyces tetrasporus]KAJ8098865.1 major facilitator superfamily domain-containing protein [Lipomyces tetrasporus]
MLAEIQRTLSRQSAAIQREEDGASIAQNTVVGAPESQIPSSNKEKGEPSEHERDPEEASQKQNPFDDVPDGGFVAWLQVSGSFFMYFNSWGLTNSFGAFENFYTVNGLSHKTASDIAWIGSFQAFLVVLIGVVTGPVFDRGYCRTLVVVGSLMVVFGLMMTSLCTEYWQVMLSQAVVCGLGEGCLFIPGIAIIPQYFSSKRAFATGVAAAGSSMGGIIYPIVFHKLEPRLGFSWATRIIAFIVLGTQAYALAVMRIRSMPKFKRSLYDPTAIGDFKFMVFTIVVFFAFAGAYVPFYYIQSFAVTRNIFDQYTAFYMLSILNAASVFGRILPNFLADKIGPINVMFPFTIFTMIMAFVWAAINNAGGCIAFAILYGFFSGAFVSLPPPVLTTLCPDLRMIGTRMGMSFAISGLGLLIGTPIAGALLQTPAQYTATASFCGGCVAVASVLIVIVRVAKSGGRIVIKV